MNKSDLIDRTAERAKLPKVDAKKAVDALFESMHDCLKAGEKITLVGFGTFSVSYRQARDGRNPQTGATMKIPAKNVVKFKPGAELSKLVN